MSEREPKVDYEHHSICGQCNVSVRAYETEMYPQDAGLMSIRWDWDHCGILWSWTGLYALPLAGIIVPMLFQGRKRAEPELSKSVLKLTTPFKTSQLESPIEDMFWFAYRELKPRELRGLVTQYRVGRYRLDFALPRIKIGIELDGHWSHSSTTAIAHDRRRQRNLEAAGWRVIRFGGREVYNDPRQCVRDTAQLVRIKRGRRR